MANWGLISIYIVTFLGMLISANKHGKQRDKVNFWISLLGYVTSLLLIWWALGWTFW